MENNISIEDKAHLNCDVSDRPRTDRLHANSGSYMPACPPFSTVPVFRWTSCIALLEGRSWGREDVLEGLNNELLSCDHGELSRIP